MILKTFDLQPLHDGRCSFYGKAKVVQWLDRMVLYSYDIRVCEYIHVEEGLDMIKIYGLWSDTTTRHIREFLLQCDVSNLSLNELCTIIDEGGAYL